MAKRVRLSTMNTTSIPWSRNHSAMRVAVKAARNRTSAGWSEVATTTTDRARPSGPRSRSRNSRTSRPRSPTRARTETWASVPRAIIDSSDDFPTPEPAEVAEGHAHDAVAVEGDALAADLAGGGEDDDGVPEGGVEARHFEVDADDPLDPPEPPGPGRFEGRRQPPGLEDADGAHRA